METDQIIPFMEAGIRVFDRYGEREKRMKARMKFLLKKLGLENFLELIEAELSKFLSTRTLVFPRLNLSLLSQSQFGLAKALGTSMITSMFPQVRLILTETMNCENVIRMVIG